MKNQAEKPIYLCGLMGAGKTAVGKQVAQKLDLPFIDLDQHIETKYSTTIEQIFKTEGEDRFRSIEREELENEMNQKAVIALGGGTLQNQKIVDSLKSGGILIFLDAPQSVLLKRLKKQSGRPLLKNLEGEERKQFLSELLKKRRQYYTQSHITVAVGDQSPEKVAELVVSRIIIE